MNRWALSIEVPGLSLLDHEPVVRAAEAAGYTDVWSEETAGHDAFTPLVMAATWSERLRLGTGVVNAFPRGPAALAGERAGEGRFKLEKPPVEPVPIYIAALRERMLQTAGELGDGAFVNYTPLAGLPRIMDEIRAGEEAAGKEPGSTDVLCRFFCIQGDREQALGLARWMFAAYATVPVYENFFRWLGYGDAIDPMVEAWRAKDRSKALELVPTDLVEDIFILGDADEQRARLGRYVEGGITTPVILPIPIVPPGTPVAPDTFVELVESLAPSR